MRPTVVAALCLMAGPVFAHPVNVESCGRSLTFPAPPSRAVAHDINMAEGTFPKVGASGCDWLLSEALIEVGGADLEDVECAAL